MCKNCYNSPMGLERRREQGEAARAFKSMKFKGYQDPAYIAAHKRCVDTGKAMSSLHNDYIWALAREQAQNGNAGPYITHADKRGR